MRSKATTVTTWACILVLLGGMQVGLARCYRNLSFGSLANREAVANNLPIDHSPRKYEYDPTQPKRALIVIDVQNEYFNGKLRIEYPDVRQSLANICQAMDAAHAAGIPVVVVQHLFPEGAFRYSRAVARRPNCTRRWRGAIVTIWSRKAWPAR